MHSTDAHWPQFISALIASCVLYLWTHKLYENVTNQISNWMREAMATPATTGDQLNTSHAIYILSVCVCVIFVGRHRQRRHHYHHRSVMLVNLSSVDSHLHREMMWKECRSAKHTHVLTVNECGMHKQLPMSYWKLNFTKIQQIASLHIIIIIVMAVVLCECELLTLFRWVWVWVLKYEHEHRCKSGCDCTFLFLIFIPPIRSYQMLTARNTFALSFICSPNFPPPPSLSLSVIYSFSHCRCFVLSLSGSRRSGTTVTVCASLIYIFIENLYHVYCVCMRIYTQSDRNFCWIMFSWNFTCTIWNWVFVRVCVCVRTSVSVLFFLTYSHVNFGKSTTITRILFFPFKCDCCYCFVAVAVSLTVSLFSFMFPNDWEPSQFGISM